MIRPRLSSEPDAARVSIAERMMRGELRSRSRQTAMAVSGALAVIAPLLVLIVGWPEALYYHALIVVFLVSVWGQHLVGRRGRPNAWPAYAFTALNFALMTFTLIYPNPWAEFIVPPSMLLRLGNFIYFFVVLAALAFSFSPGLVIWGGVCGAVFWSLGRLWVVMQSGTSSVPAAAPRTQEQFEAMLAASLNPRTVDMGVWVQEVAVLLVVSCMLAMVVRGSRRLVQRQARLERRGANLARYLPRELAERMAEADEPFVEDRKTNAAVLFSDVVGFTGWAESRDPAEVVDMLRAVHALVAEEVFRAGGVLDKFIGDGAMATFGASAADENAPDSEISRRALSCADGILSAAAAWNAQRAARGETPVRLSVGLHLGTVVVGDVGSRGRMELATVGDAVNVASRLEAMSRKLDCAAVASGALMTAAGTPPPEWSFRGGQQLAGRREMQEVWTRPMAGDDPAGRTADDPREASA